MKTKNKTIQNIAGEILLYFYILYRKKPEELEKQVFDFFTNNGIVLKNKNKDSELVNRYSDIDLYNALRYLKNKNFVSFAGNGGYIGGEVFHVIELTELGVDIVEDIEKKDCNENKFVKIFNLNINFENLLEVQNNFTIESIIKNSIL